MKKIHLLLMFLCLSSISEYSLAEHPDFSLIVTQENCEPIIHITITNNSSNEISLNDYSLPWRDTPLSMSLLIQSTDSSRKKLDQFYGFDDVDSISKIMPGHKIQGQIILSDRFPTLKDKLIKADHVLFWQYNFDYENTSKIKHGSALLKKCS